MFVSRALTVSVLCAAVLSAAPEKPPAATDKALRVAISRFYTLLVEKKYRAAEVLVAKESRDDYYTGEKPSILDFKVDAIRWEHGFHEASVSMVSKTRLRRAVLGEFEVTVPYLSHWIFERGAWFWYVPKVDVRETPFGKMKIDPKAASEAPHSEVDLKKLIASGPKPAEFANGVRASRETVGATGSQDVELENTLAIPVTLQVKVVDGKGFSADPVALAPHAKGKLTVKRDAEGFVAGRLLVTSEQTGQTIYIAVQ